MADTGESKSKVEVITGSVEETIDLAADFSGKITSGSIIGLSGELGTGKTHFVKGVVKGLGGDPEQVDSPTFAIINEYRARLPVYHMDCYRLESEEEAAVIGMESYFEGSGICLVEWPERIKGLLPATTIWVSLTHVSETKRKIIFGYEPV